MDLKRRTHTLHPHRSGKSCPLNLYGLLQKYIDFELSQRQRERVRDLYERLLERTSHVKIWTSFAAFEAKPLPAPEEEEGEEEPARVAEAGVSGAESVEQREARSRRCGIASSISWQIEDRNVHRWQGVGRGWGGGMLSSWVLNRDLGGGGGG